MIPGGFWDTQLIIQFIVVVAIPCYDLRLPHTLSVMLCYKGITGITQFPVGPAPSAPSAYDEPRKHHQEVWVKVWVLQRSWEIHGNWQFSQSSQPPKIQKMGPSTRSQIYYVTMASGGCL